MTQGLRMTRVGAECSKQGSSTGTQSFRNAPWSSRVDIEALSCICLNMSGLERSIQEPQVHCCLVVWDWMKW